MSDSDFSDAPVAATPSDATLEKGLRKAVAKTCEEGNRDDLTVKRMRAATEKSLSLPEGWFKAHARWKAESERIIRDEAEKHEDAPSSPVKVPTPKSEPKKPSKSAKRASLDADTKPSKRRKTATIDESNDDLSSPPTDLSDDEPKRSKTATAKAIKPRGPPKKTANPKQDRIVESDDAGDVVPWGPKDRNDESNSDGGSKTNGATKGADSGSELSVVLDPSPKALKKKRKSSELASKVDKKSKKVPKSQSKDESNLSPDAEEIKRLQGWLIKCGIRKMWYRELAEYETAKAKINHLKSMLTEAGMEGRYSNEKARQIKEERELKADVDLVQEGAKRWGAGDDGSEVDEDRKPRRRLAKGLKELEELNSDGGEETD